MALSINQFYFSIFMEIIIYRRRFTRWGVDGTLVIKGTKVCNTIEHPERFLPAGDYEIAFVSIANKSRKMPVILRKGQTVWEVGINTPCLKPGNGPMTLENGCIILGKAAATGLVIHSQEYFDRLCERLRKASKKMECIKLRIIDWGSDEISIAF